MRVNVSNGNQVINLHICPRFKWKIQGVEFEDPVRLLRLGGSDMILGVMDEISQSCVIGLCSLQGGGDSQGQESGTQGHLQPAELKNMTVKNAKHLLKKGQALWAYLFTILATKMKADEEEIPVAIANILQQYAYVFAEPTTLPPKRPHDHYIPLKRVATSVSINAIQV